MTHEQKERRRKQLEKQRQALMDWYQALGEELHDLALVTPDPMEEKGLEPDHPCLMVYKDLAQYSNLLGQDLERGLLAPHTGVVYPVNSYGLPALKPTEIRGWHLLYRPPGRHENPRYPYGNPIQYHLGPWAAGEKAKAVEWLLQIAKDCGEGNELVNAKLKPPPFPYPRPEEEGPLSVLAYNTAMQKTVREFWGLVRDGVILSYNFNLGTPATQGKQ